MNQKKRIITSILILTVLLLGCLGSGPKRVEAREEALKVWGTYTPTPTRTPTVTSTPDKMHFSMSNSSGVAPEDALAEMTFFQGGGCYNCGVCDPNLTAVQPSRPLMVPISLNVCWPQNEGIRLTVYRPDGRMDSTALQGYTNGVVVTYQPQYDFPPGEYRLQLSGSRTTREFRVTFYAPYGPRVMAVPDSPFLPNYGFLNGYARLALDGFVPGERVRLFAYHYNPSDAALKLLGWQEWTIRGDGRMPVSVELPELTGSDVALFAAYGERSGEVHYLQVIGDNYVVDPIPDRVLFCPGAKQSRLTPNFRTKANLAARVAHTDGTRLRIHESAGFSSRTISLVPEGTEITLTGGPACVDRSWFWQIQWGNVAGWVAEADQKDYLVEPLFPRLLPVATMRPALPVRPRP